MIKLNRIKAYGYDGILGWVLKENVDFLVGSIVDIFNLLYRESRFFLLWKEVDVVSVFNKYFRFIFLILILLKIAEEYIVEFYVKFVVF